MDPGREGRRSIGRGPAGAFRAICEFVPQRRPWPSFTPESHLYTRPFRGRAGHIPRSPSTTSRRERLPQEGRRLPVPESIEPIWSGIRDDLRRETPDLKFHIWLDPLEPAAVQGQTLYVKAPEHIRGWVGERYLPLLRRAAERHLGGGAAVRIVGSDWRAGDGERAEVRAVGPACTL